MCAGLIALLGVVFGQAVNAADKFNIGVILLQYRRDAAEHLHHAVGALCQQAGQPSGSLPPGALLSIHRDNTAADLGGDDNIIFRQLPGQRFELLRGLSLGGGVLHIGDDAARKFRAKVRLPL